MCCGGRGCNCHFENGQNSVLNGAGTLESPYSWDAVASAPITIEPTVDGIYTDASEGNVFELYLSDDAGINGPSNGEHGQLVMFIIKQNTSSAKTCTLSSAFKFGTTIPAWVMSTGLGKIDVILAMYSENYTSPGVGKWLVLATSQGF